MIDILVQIQTVNKYKGEFAFQGLDHFSSKKEFLSTVGKIWDAVRDNSNLKASFQLTNMNEA